MDPIHTKKCFHAHTGHWMMEKHAFIAMEQFIRSQKINVVDMFQKEQADHAAEKRDNMLQVRVTDTGIMLIPVEGTIMKSHSSFGGTTSSVEVRRALRNAANDPEIKGVIMVIDSPGGTVDGTDSLAEEVKRTNALKPVYTHFDGLLASAAYWTAAYSERISGSRTSKAGSLGTFVVVQDLSEHYEKEGVKTHVISTGKFKGSFVAGTEITEDQLEDLQGMVDGLNQFFKNAVMEGRGMSSEQVNTLFDGRVHLSDKALEMGLIDAVETLEGTLAAMNQRIAQEPANDPSARARAKIQIEKARVV